jgi:O-succinylbenzoic acid--CoA ligase
MLASSLSLVDGWFETHDLGEFENDHLVIIGRSDDVIITGGENLSLSAVENSLATAFPNLQCAAFSMDDPQWGQSLYVAIVGEIDDALISAQLEKSLGVHAKPKGIIHRASLPLLSIGKVDRKRLAMEIPHE